VGTNRNRQNVFTHFVQFHWGMATVRGYFILLSKIRKRREYIWKRKGIYGENGYTGLFLQ